MMHGKDTDLEHFSPDTHSNKMDPSFKVRSADSHAVVGNIEDSTNDDENLVVAQNFGLDTSDIDDSRFNKATSDDRDEIVGDRFMKKFSCCGTEESVKKNTKSDTSQNSVLRRDKQNVCLKKTTSSTDIVESINLALDMNTINVLGTQETSSHLVHLSRKDTRVHHHSIRNISASRRCRATTPNSVVRAGTPASPRTHRSRNFIPRDLNNNESGYRNLNSYLRKPPFKLQDCFQDQGLLSIVACIAYTFFLMIVFCGFGFITDSLKSLIGTQNLKSIRANIAHSRYTRSTMSSG